MVERSLVEREDMRRSPSDIRLYTILFWMREQQMPVVEGMLNQSWIKNGIAKKMLGGDLTSPAVYKRLFGDQDREPTLVRDLKTISRSIQIDNLQGLLDKTKGVNSKKDAKRRLALENLINHIPS